MGETKLVILIGNAEPQMFRYFMRDGGGGAVSIETDSLDGWTRRVVDALAQDLDAKAVYPFDEPYLPFQQWARTAGALHQSPLGLNIHKTYGLWHAYRAALLFPVQFDLPQQSAGSHPCESCPAKPCLSACPVSAFDGRNYDVDACAAHLHSSNSCMESGCLARLACPVGVGYQYERPQIQFHMKAFKNSHEL